MSDIARVYPNGQELAKGGQTGGQPEQNGKEKASLTNQHLAHGGTDLTK